jgi:hypothetical protein
MYHPERMSPVKYVDVVVEEHDELPDGCELRFHAVGDPREVRRLRYEPLVGPEGEFAVTAVDATGAETPAHAVPVDDSGAGTSLLIYGGARGLRLRRTDAPTEAAIAEPYLLLSDDSLLD